MCLVIWLEQISPIRVGAANRCCCHHFRTFAGVVLAELVDRKRLAVVVVVDLVRCTIEEPLWAVCFHSNYRSHDNKPDYDSIAVVVAGAVGMKLEL